MAQDARSIIIQTCTSRKRLWGVIVASQKGTKRPIRFVSCARASTGWTCVNSADNSAEQGQTTKHQRLPQAKTNGVLTCVQGG
jgi:hypothetical protein